MVLFGKYSEGFTFGFASQSLAAYANAIDDSVSKDQSDAPGLDVHETLVLY
jgi:hypothetical protein